VHGPTRIATLEEVLDLINCYDEGVAINLETKLDPLNANETLPVEKYITDLWPIIQRKGLANRTTIQSFDWRTLVGIHERFPEVTLVALLDDITTLFNEAVGGYPWLGGVDLDALNGDWIAAAHSIGAKVVSPVHGVPPEGTPDTPGYQPFVTREVVKRAHGLGMIVAPWTVDYEVTANKMIDDGVDVIISNYPEKVMWVGQQRGLSMGRGRNPRKPECLVTAGE
jgi:glycerophosphoryl diester phosphodiesterase